MNIFNQNELLYRYFATFLFALIIAMLLEFTKLKLIKHMIMIAQKEEKKSLLLDTFFAKLKSPISLLIWYSFFSILINIFNKEVELNIPVKYSVSSHKIIIVIVSVWVGHLFSNSIAENTDYDNSSNSIFSDPSARNTLSKIMKIIFYIIAVLTALSLLGIPMQAAIAFGGVSGLAISFASKDIISNLLSGIMLELERPFSIGEDIEIISEKIEGKIKKVGFRSTEIEMLDKKKIYVPNSIFTTASIINTSRRKIRTIYETIPLMHCSDRVVPQIISNIEQFLSNHTGIESSQLIQVSLKNCNINSLDLLIWCYTNKISTQDYNRILEEVILSSINIIKTNGGEVAFNYISKVPTRRQGSDGDSGS